VRLAKNFGSEKGSRKFVNGVLGTIYRELINESDEK
jgi:transcription termination factor NusB